MDDKGNAYVTGSTISSDFPVTLGAFQNEKKGDAFTDSGFVTKLNTTPIH
ncbi:SBBP repeat-containing protein [Wukongibacter baidiensis]